MSLKNESLFIFFVFFCYIILISTAGAANRIMPLGDSITRGVVGSTDDTGYRRSLYITLIDASFSVDFVGSHYNGILNDFDKDHEGHGGWRADEIVSGRSAEPWEGKLDEWLVAEEPDIVLLHIGTNDISFNNQNWTEIEDILVVIDDYEFASGKAVWVILSLIIDRSCVPFIEPCAKSAETTAFNNDVRDYVFFPRYNGGDKIILVDMQNDAGIDYDRSPVGDMSDDLHPFDTGYAKMADLWFSALRGVLRPCPWPSGHLDYCRDCGPCAEGIGDCDNNSECEGGLVCVQIPGVDTCRSEACALPLGHFDYCRDCGPCAEGEGDCDSDSECESGLVCNQVPGVDQCEPVCPYPVGHLNYCRDCGPCTEGEGDCDNNSECQADLTCVQIPGVDTCRREGCTLALGDLDYCRDCGPCAEGEGDCDSDGECQSGLVCVQIPGTDTCQAP